METVNQIGALLNLVGIVVALYGLTTERSMRGIPSARQKLRVWRRQVWQRLRPTPRNPGPVAETARTGGMRLGGAGLSPHQWLKVSPTDPLETQIAHLDSNAQTLRRYVDYLDGMHKRSAASRAKSAERVRKRVNRLEADAKTSAETERAISSRAIRVEIWGVGIALLGTGLSSVATLMEGRFPF